MIATPLPGGRIERALARVGVPDHVARLLGATPSLRLSWLGAAMAAIDARRGLPKSEEPSSPSSKTESEREP